MDTEPERLHAVTLLAQDFIPPFNARLQKTSSVSKFSEEDSNPQSPCNDRGPTRRGLSPHRWLRLHSASGEDGTIYLTVLQCFFVHRSKAFT